MQIIPKRKIFFSLSGALIIISALSLLVFGLRLGIDFTGGSLLEIQFYQEMTADKIRERLQKFELEKALILPTDQGSWILRTREMNEEMHQKVLESLLTFQKETKKQEEDGLQIKQIDGPEGIGLQVDTAKEEDKKIGQELRFDSIGPSIGTELKEKSIYAIITVLGAIILYIAWAFRKVSKPISSWKYGLVAIIALFHDVFIVVGIFSIFGYIFGIEVNTPFVAALLTILGYSVNDTIVVFDRIRENIKMISSRSFEEVVNESVNQTMRRSINTSFTTVLVLLSLYFWGGQTIKYFVLTLLLGVIIGTYSSIFLASPLLVYLQRQKQK